MPRVIIWASTVLSVLAATSAAQAQFVTRARLQCDNNINATAKVRLTRNGSTILEQTLSCTSGQDNPVILRTEVKPNDCYVELTVTNTTTGHMRTCTRDGTSFRARVRCTASPTGATVWLIKPRKAP